MLKVVARTSQKVANASKKDSTGTEDFDPEKNKYFYLFYFLEPQGSPRSDLKSPRLVLLGNFFFISINFADVSKIYKCL